MKDPRFQEVLALIELSRATDETNIKERSEIDDAFVRKLESIADDPLASDCDRNLARGFLDMGRVGGSMLIGETIAAMAKESTSANPQARAAAARVLRRLSEEMRKRGMDISQWAKPPPAGKPQ